MGFSVEVWDLGLRIWDFGPFRDVALYFRV